MATEMHWIWQVVVAAMLVVAGIFSLVGAVGMLRFPDFFMRLHAPTKATTLGVGGVLLASLAANWGQGNHGLHELLITLFLFITAPVSANLMAKAALHDAGLLPTRAVRLPLVQAGDDEVRDLATALAEAGLR
jgi:multicomponent K+:H+ antiporter subunit G